MLVPTVVEAAAHSPADLPSFTGDRARVPSVLGASDFPAGRWRVVLGAHGVWTLGTQDPLPKCQLCRRVGWEVG